MADNDVKRDEFSFLPNFNQEMILITTQLNKPFPPDVLVGKTDRFNDQRLIDIFGKSAGTAFISNTLLALKRLELPNDIPPEGLFFENFFTSIAEESSSNFSVQMESNANGKIIYDLVFSWQQAAPTGNLDLIVFTLKDPPGSFPTFPVTVTPPFQGEVVKRLVGGNQFVYDYFLLCPPP